MSLSKTASLYGIRSNGGFHGDVYTSPVVVRYMLDIVGYKGNSDLRNIRVLEPSCGKGEFIIEIAHRLLHSAALFHFDANEAFQRNVRAYDIDGRKIEHCRKRLMDIGVFPSEENLQVGDFLKCKTEKADVVVGNPPYIRYENIPEDMRNYCRCNYSTFHYRCDLYVPFLRKHFLYSPQAVAIVLSVQTVGLKMSTEKIATAYCKEVFTENDYRP